MAIVSLEQLWGNHYRTAYSKPDLKKPIEVWKNLFEQATKQSSNWCVESIKCRIRSTYDADIFKKILVDLGFNKKSERIEYQIDVEKLPDDKNSPFMWKSASDLGWNEHDLIHFVSEVTKNAIGFDPNEKLEDFIQDFLKRDELTSGFECIHIGFLNETQCALAVVQIEQSTGWSRISYMGLIPEYRNKNLGSYVHRHGFEMMKAQGGKLYHGGTDLNNISMRKLFKKHGCEFLYQMEEWSLNIGGQNEV